MPAHLIGPLPESTPAGVVTSRSQRALPADLLREASLRLGIFSFLVGVLWVLGILLGHVRARAMMPPGDTRWMQLGMTDAIAAGAIALSIGLFMFTRRTTRAPQFVLDLGLAYMVVMAAALGLMWHWDGAPDNYQIYTQISWVGVMLLMFAAILPTSTPKMLIAGSIAVAMNPIGMLIAHTRGLWNLGSVEAALLMHYPDFLLVPVAVVISRVVTQLGRQVTKARELGSYQLGDLLGRGGMGEVYKAKHRMLARPAAIKLIRPEALGGQDAEAAQLAVKRFYREAESAATLRSPHTVEIYDFGITQ